jgi:hypothetical protein
MAVALVASAAALGLGGCSGSLIADHMPAAVGGLPEGAPERPAAEQVYPAVHNMPPARATSTLNDDEQKRLQDDLVAARNRTGAGSETPPATGSTGNSPAGGARNP